MITLNQRQRNLASRYADGSLSQMYAAYMSGKVSESNIPYLLTEINTALELALENRSWRDYFELTRLQSDVSSYDSFEFIGD